MLRINGAEHALHLTATAKSMETPKSDIQIFKSANLLRDSPHISLILSRHVSATYHVLPTTLTLLARSSTHETRPFPRDPNY